MGPSSEDGTLTVKPEAKVAWCRFTWHEIHGGGANEADKRLAGAVHLKWRPHLLHHAVLHHRDAITQGHGFFLVVGDVHAGGLQLFVQTPQLGTCVVAHLGIEVGQGSSNKKQAGSRTMAAQGDPLLLPTRHRAGLSVQQLFDPSILRSPRSVVLVLLWAPCEVAKRRPCSPLRLLVRVQRVVLNTMAMSRSAGSRG